jgi:integrase
MPNYQTADIYLSITPELLGTFLNRSHDLGHKDWVRANMVMVWAYGIRRSEIKAVYKRDFSFRSGYLILRSVPLKNPEKPDRVMPLKVDTTPYLDLLIDYLNSIDFDDPVLPKSTHTFWRRLKKIDKRLSPHVFRHNRGTEISFATDNPYEIAGFMGHSDIRSAQSYQHKSGVHGWRLGQKLDLRKNAKIDNLDLEDKDK